MGFGRAGTATRPGERRRERVSTAMVPIQSNSAYSNVVSEVGPQTEVVAQLRRDQHVKAARKSPDIPSAPSTCLKMERLTG